MKLIRRFFLALSLLFVVRLYLGSYDELISAQIQRALKEQRIPCDVVNVSVRPILRPTIGQLTCHVPNGDPIVLTGLIARFMWTDLLMLRPGIQLAWEQSGGLFSVVLHRAIGDGRSDMDVRVTGASLNQFPQTTPVMFDGKLSAALTVHLDNAGKASGEGDFRVEGLGVSPNKSKLSLLPEIQAGDLYGKLLLQGSELVLKPVDLTSSLGDLNGEMHVIIETPNSAAYSGTASIQLNEEGVKRVGGFLALAAQKDVQHPAEDWAVTVSGHTGNPPKISVQPK